MVACTPILLARNDLLLYIMMQKVFCCIFSSLKLFVKPKSLENIFTLSAYMKCQLWNTKKLENCAVLRSIQIITEIAGFQTYILHKYIHYIFTNINIPRYITILTYRKLHIQTYFLPSCICRQEKRWWEYIRTCNIKQYTSVL